MQQVLAGKKALVTGASRGIGAAIARRLAADGATVTITYVGSKEPADQVVKEIGDAGGEARAVLADARETGSGENTVAEVIKLHGGLDILVSNAGINISKPLDAIEDEDYEAVFGVNVRGSLEMIRAAAKRMKPGGRIVVISATIANSYFAPGLG